jgi:hypothetical protein
VRFEITVEELQKVSKLLLESTKERRVKAALKSMFNELNKGYSHLVRRVLGPLYEINSVERFDKDFNILRAKFKEMELGAVSCLSEIHCTNVTEQLQKLRESNSWRSAVPGLRRSLARLDLILDQWIENDAVLYQADQSLMNRINSMMDEIAERRSKGSRAAYTDMRKSLQCLEPHVKHLNRLFKQMEMEFARSK